MARKRLNTKFVVIISVAFGLAVAAAVGAMYASQRNKEYTNDQLIAAISENESRGDYLMAANINRELYKRDRREVKYLIGAGDQLMKLTSEDPNRYREALAMYRDALVARPGYMPALIRLLNEDEAEARAGRLPWRQLVERTQAVLQAAEAEGLAELPEGEEPVDIERVRALAAIAVINETADGTGADRRQAAVERLQEMVGAGTDEGEVYSVLVFARLSEASRAGRLNEPEGEADRLAAQEIIAKGLQAHPEDPQVLQELAQASLSLMRSVPAGEQREGYEQQVRELMDRMRTHISAESEDFVEQRLALAGMEQLLGQAAAARDVLAETLKARPEALQVRLALASQKLTAGEADEAMDLLTDYPEPPTLVGREGFQQREQELLVRAVQARSRLALAKGAEGAERERLLSAAESDLDYIRSVAGESPQLLRIQGELQLIEGDITGALSSLTNANTRLGGQFSTQKIEVLQLLAQAHMARQQTGAARDVLEQLLTIPNIETQPQIELQIRQQLIRLLAQEGNMDAAREQVAVLREKYPDDPTVVQLTLAVGDTNDPAMLASIRAMQEETSQQVLQKMTLLARYEQQDEVLRLAERLVELEPQNASVAVQYARLLASTGKREEAGRVITEALARMPDEETLKVANAQLSGDQATIDELAAERLANMSEEDRGQAAVGQLLREGKNDEALALMKDLHAKDPGGFGTQALFDYHLQQNEPAEARTLLSSLREADQMNAGTYEVRVLLIEDKLDQAINLARSLTRQNETVADAWTALALALLADGQAAEAVRTFERALALQPNNATALRGIVMALDGQGRLEQAGTYLTRSRRVRPNDPILADRYLVFQALHGDWREAVNGWSRIVNANPANLNAQLRLVQTYAIALNRLEAGTPAHTELAGEAAQAASAARAAAPGELTFTRELARLLMLVDRDSEAEQLLRQTVASASPQQVEPATGLLANFYAEQGNMAEAIRILEAYLQSPEGPGVAPRLQLSQFKLAQEDLEGALAVLNTNDEPVVLARAQLLLQAERGEEARAAISPMLQGQPSAAVLSMAGNAALLSRDLQEAQSLYERVLQAEPGNGPANLQLGRIELLRQGGSTNRARSFLDRAEALMPDNPDVYMLQAQASLLDGNPEAARERMYRAYGLAPQNRQVVVTLAEQLAQANPPRWQSLIDLLAEARQNESLAADPELFRIEAQMWQSRNNPTSALASAREAVRLDGQNPTYLSLYYNLMNTAGDFRRVLSDTQQLMGQYQQDPWIYAVRTAAHMGLRDNRSAQAEVANALKMLLEANRQNEALAMASEASRLIGPVNVLPLVQQAVENSDVWRVRMARLFGEQRDLANAWAMVEPVVGKEKSLPVPMQAEFYQVVVQKYLSDDPPQFDKAVPMLREQARLAPGNVLVLNNLAYALTQLGEFEEALTHAESAYNQTSPAADNAGYIADTYGWALVRAGRLETGISVLEGAARQVQIPDVHWHLAEAYMLQNDPASAERAARRGLELLEAEVAAGTPNVTLKTRLNDVLSQAEQKMAQDQ